MRIFTLVAGTYLLLALLATLYFIANYPLEATAGLIYDDAYYYLGVVQNIAQGKGSSFGAVVDTNGYQPLWALVLASSIYLFSLQKLWTLALIPTLIFLIKSFSLFKLSALKGVQAAPLLFSAVLLVMLYPGIFSNGLETCMLLLCLPLLSLLKELPENFSAKASLKIGAIFIFLFLIRLDFLAIMAAFCLLNSPKVFRGKRGVAMNMALVILITAAAVSVYFLVNYFLFGTIVPVSGQSKSLGNKVGENIPLLWKYLIFSRLAIIALILNFVLIKNIRHDSVDKTLFSNELRLAIIASLIVAFYYALFSGWPIWSWYYWPTALVTLYAIAKLIYLSVLNWKQYERSPQLVALLLSSWIFLAYVSFLAVKTELSTGIFRTLASQHLDRPQQQNYTTMNIALINDFFSTAPDGIVAMGDRAGGLGFWLPERFKFFHTEGLVANKDYLLARKSGTAVDYLKKIGIRYFVVDRERLFEGKLKNGTAVHGIVEPVQAMSAHSGLVLICLPVNAILFSQRYEAQTRYVYDFSKVIDCPDEISARVDALASNYGELRKYSLPSEYVERGLFKRYVLNP